MLGNSVLKAAKTSSRAAPSSSEACQPENTTSPEIDAGSNAGDAAADSAGAEAAGLAAGVAPPPPPPVQALNTNAATEMAVTRLRRMIVLLARTGADGAVRGRVHPATTGSGRSLRALGHG